MSELKESKESANGDASALSSASTSASAKSTSFPKKSIRVLLLEKISSSAVSLFVREGFQVEVAEKMGEAELLSKVGSYHAVGVRSKTQLTAEVLRAGSRLLTVGCFCIGTDQTDLAAAASQGIAVFNAPFANTRSVAELVIAEMIALARQMTDRSRECHLHQWNKVTPHTPTSQLLLLLTLLHAHHTTQPSAHPPPSAPSLPPSFPLSLCRLCQLSSRCYEVRGKTVCIVGYGHVGSQLSILAEAMGMRVQFYDIVPKLPLGLAVAKESLEEALDGADFVSLHVPATAQTAGLVGAQQLGRMKRGAFLLNASRGSVVDLDAVAAALRSGQLGGAAIDVFEREPAASDETFNCPLVGLPNVILTPHIGGSTEEAQVAIGVEVASKMIAFINSGASIGAVNLPELSLPPHPTTHRILNVHANVPGVLRDVNHVLSDYNVVAQLLMTLGPVGYLIVDVERGVSAEIKAKIATIKHSIKTRLLY